MSNKFDFYLWYFYHECASEIPFLQDCYGDHWLNAAQEIGYALLHGRVPGGRYLESVVWLDYGVLFVHCDPDKQHWIQ